MRRSPWRTDSTGSRRAIGGCDFGAAFSVVADDEPGGAMVALVSGFITLSEVARREIGVPAG